MVNKEQESKKGKTGVINDPLGQPTVPAVNDFRSILKFCHGRTDGQTDNLCENSDHYWPRLWSASWIKKNPSPSYVAQTRVDLNDANAHSVWHKQKSSTCVWVLTRLIHLAESADFVAKIDASNDRSRSTYMYTIAESLCPFGKNCFFLVVFWHFMVFFIVCSWFSKYGFMKTTKRLGR